MIAQLDQRRQDFALALVNGRKQNPQTLTSHVIVLADWLWEIRSDSPALLIGATLLYNRRHPLSCNSAFATATLVSQYCRQQQWHPRAARSLICAALTMDLGLGSLAQQQFNNKVLTPEQQQQFQLHPKTTVRWLHQHGITDRLWLQTIADHHELLDGGGFPSHKANHQLATASRLLALVSRLIELLTPRKWRPAYSISQALRFLAGQPRRFDAQLLQSLAAFLLPYLPGNVVQLQDGQQMILQQLGPDEDQLKGCPLFKEQDKLQISPPSTIHIEDIVHQLPPQPLAGTEVITRLWQDTESTLCEHNDHSGEQLTPQPALLEFLDDIQQGTLSTSQLRQRWQQHQSLGRLLLNHLHSHYPGHQFQDSHHAVLMLGVQQAQPLLTRLALQQQLQTSYFPAQSQLTPKISGVLRFAALLTADNHQLLPAQATMFALLNLAPLYVEPALHNQLPPRQPALAGLPLNNAMSLMGLPQQSRHLKFSYQLARHWHQPKAILEGIRLLSEGASATMDTPPMAQQLAASFQASLLLTHHCFHQRAINDPQIAPQLLETLKQLGITQSQLGHILEQFLQSHPFSKL